MCIALLSTAHPAYKLILIDNRDEYINRPTAPAQWWPPPHEDVLGGRDLLRDIHGTWLGITRSRKIAVLTNFREETPPAPDAISRGGIIRRWLTEDVSIEDFVATAVNTGLARDAGGFSLVCGNVGERLAVISNRASDHSQVPWICGETIQTIGLSNAAFVDRSWKKVQEGEELMLHTIRECVRDNVDEDGLIAKFITLLSRDTLRRVDQGTEAGLEAHIKDLRNTVFVPPLGRRESSKLPGDEIALGEKSDLMEVFNTREIASEKSLGISGLYGTQKQTVVLIDHNFRVRFFERSLFDANSLPIEAGKGDVDVNFSIS